METFIGTHERAEMLKNIECAIDAHLTRITHLQSQLQAEETELFFYMSQQRHLKNQDLEYSDYNQNPLHHFS